MEQSMYNDIRKHLIRKMIQTFSNPVINIIVGIVCLLVILIIAMKLHHFYNRNPYLLELRQIIKEQYGTDFSVVIDYSKNDKISMIVIESTDEIYLKKDIFAKVNNIQKTVYKYILQHQEHFCDIDWFTPKSYEEGQEKKGIKLRFENSDWTNSSGLSGVFSFYNNLEYNDENADGFNSLVVIAGSGELYSHYNNIKVSGLVEFSNVNYIQCCDLVTDAEDAAYLKKMKNLKEISVGNYDEELQKVAKEMGIECSVYG